MVFVFEPLDIAFMFIMGFLSAKALQLSGRAYEAGRHWESHALASVLFWFVQIAIFAMSFEGSAP